MDITARTAFSVARSFRSPLPTTAFRGADEAWFWTMAALSARHNGVRTAPCGALRRPCDPDDVVNCLDRLLQRGKISLKQARILQHWGERQRAPSPNCIAERDEARLWQAALDVLDWPLRLKGIVA